MKVSLNLAALVFLSRSLIVSAQKSAYKNSSLRGNGNGNPSNGKKTYIISFKRDKRDPPNKKGDPSNKRGGPSNKRGGPSSKSKCDALAWSHGGSVGHIYDKVLNGCSISLPPQAFDALSKNPNVVRIEEDHEVTAYSSPASHNLFAAELSAESTISTDIWGLDRIDQCNLPLDGLMTKQDASGVKVYILDTGIKGNHEDFVGVLSSSDCHRDFVGEGNALSDGNGHGTHVASTACGLEYGVSANCDLCAIKVLSASGNGSWSGVIAGINYVAANCDGNKCVANMSLGGSFSSALNTAMADAVDAGVTFVVAAGNDNEIACDYSPASEPKAITVGSTTITDGISYFSNYGTCVDVYAPGSSITAAWNTSPTATKSIDGTSMASPHVAGIAAGILGGGAANSPAEVAAEIAARAGIYGIDSRTPGAGLATVNCSDSRTPTSAPAPTSAPTPCPGNTLTVELQTDNYPEETSWTLMNTCTSTTVGSKAEGDYVSKRALFTEVICDSAGNAEYSFTINDTVGDGICCSFGIGSYKVKMNGVEQISGREFTNDETKTFGSCAITTPPPASNPTPQPTNPPTNTPPPTSNPTPQPTNPPTNTPPPTSNPTPQPTNPPTNTPPPTNPPTSNVCQGKTLEVEVLTDLYPKESSWTLTNECSNEDQESVGLRFYDERQTTYTTSYCVPDAKYKFEFFDSFGDGICCSYGSGTYKVRMDGDQVASGDSFRFSEATSFGSCPSQTITASYDGDLGAPKCIAVGVACTSGDLLNSRGAIGVSEPNQPNTLDGCTDGANGVYHFDESIDMITVKAVGGGLLQAGGRAVVEAKVWAYSDGGSDWADFYYNAGDMTNPNWQIISENVPADGGGERIISSGDFILTSSSVQAVRVNFRFTGSPGSCSTGAYDDTDDIVFQVAAANALGVFEAPGPIMVMESKPQPAFDCETIGKKDKQRCATATSCVWKNGKDKGCHKMKLRRKGSAL